MQHHSSANSRTTQMPTKHFAHLKFILLRGVSEINCNKRGKNSAEKLAAPYVCFSSGNRPRNYLLWLMCVKRAMNKYCACFKFDFCHCGWYRDILNRRVLSSVGSQPQILILEDSARFDEVFLLTPSILLIWVQLPIIICTQIKDKPNCPSSLQLLLFYHSSVYLLWWC